MKSLPEIESLFNEGTKGVDWKQYLNPTILKYPLNIKTELVNMVTRLAPEVGGDFINAMQALAGLAKKHLPILEGMISQNCWAACSEAIMPDPFNARWHLVLFKDQLWLSDEEMLPYDGGLTIPRDGQNRVRGGFSRN